MEAGLSILGYPIAVILGTSKTASANFKQDTITLTLPAGLTKRQMESVIEALIWRVLAKAYQSYFQGRLEAINREYFKLDPLPKLDVRRQYRRWGSYSTRNYIHLSHRLLLAPAELADYVIIHEMAHAIELNHSQRFWRLVSSACPDYRIRREKLMEFSAGLPYRGKVPPKLIEGICRQIKEKEKTAKGNKQDKLGILTNFPWKR